uniref:Xyloglucan endotransglucosylase/hydrolase n=1 Tax=Oryza barthii TaxID=65489 RepID=A0A0D3FC96_9ORYZ
MAIIGRRQQQGVAAAAATLVALMAVVVAAAAEAQPSPGVYPSRMFRAREFGRDFRSLWGAEHQQQEAAAPETGVTVWLDRRSGSGFKSRRAYRSGYFGAWVRLQRGYTAGVITAFYLSNGEAHPGWHDEVDMEFLGTTPGKPYTLQTNVFSLGSGDPPRFLVDDVPIRRYGRRSAGGAAGFPARPMWVYGSIWDASSWATEDGRYRADYRYQPFVARFSAFLLRGCSPHAPRTCAAPVAGDLTAAQLAAMRWAQRFHMVYNYCYDPKRDHSLTPECRTHLHPSSSSSNSSSSSYHG